jgi:hypothetical protein
MARFEGSGALKLDFATSAEVTVAKGMTTTMPVMGGRAGLRLASSGVMRGPDKYKMLDHRRRQAQIKARRLLDLIEEAE